jgi:hypothetical protein
MDRSRFERTRPGRGPAALAATVAAVGVLALGAGAAPAAAAGKQCGTVAGETSDATWAHVEVEDVRGVSCAAARKIVRQCLARRKVKGWAQIPAHQGPGLRKGRRRIEIDAICRPAPSTSASASAPAPATAATTVTASAAVSASSARPRGAPRARTRDRSSCRRRRESAGRGTSRSAR